SVFGEVYDKKRLAPGQIMSVGPEELEHDCSTLGGNSGSPVVRLGTGEVVGLHFSGVFLQANYAVPAPRVRELLAGVQKGALPGAIQVDTTDRTDSASVDLQDSGGSAAKHTFRFDVPVEITVRVGGMSLAPSDGGDGNGDSRGGGRGSHDGD